MQNSICLLSEAIWPKNKLKKDEIFIFLELYLISCKNASTKKQITICKSKKNGQ